MLVVLVIHVCNAFRATGLSAVFWLSPAANLYSGLDLATGVFVLRLALKTLDVHDSMITSHHISESG